MKGWRKGEFLFCFVVIWTAALFQGYGLYQEWKEEQRVWEAYLNLSKESLIDLTD